MFLVGNLSSIFLNTNFDLIYLQHLVSTHSSVGSSFDMCIMMWEELLQCLKVQDSFYLHLDSYFVE